MSLNTALVSYLQADTALAALIVDRIYPEFDSPEDHLYPLAVYKLDVTPLMANDGPIGLETATLTIAAIAPTYAQAKDVGSALQTALDGKRGTWSGVVVQGAFLNDDGVTDDVVTEPTTRQILYYIKELTFTIAYVR